jgi:hypothetical protein
MPDHVCYVAAAVVDSYDGTISKDDSTPIVIVVPGLTSDSTAAVSPDSCSTN